MQSPAIVLVDVVAAAGAVTATHTDLRKVLRSAFADARIDWDACTVEAQGDGVVISVPPELPQSRLADLLPQSLVAELRRYNSVRSTEAAVKLRVSLHLGDAREGASQIVDAIDAESILKQSSGLLALLLSDRFYHDFVVRDAAAEPESFRKAAGAWLRVPDADPFVGQAAEQTWHARLATLREQSPAAHDLLQVCAFLAPRPISVGWFTGSAELTGSPELSRIFGDPAVRTSLVHDLESSGLGLTDQVDTVQVHPMLQVALRNRMTAEDHANLRRAAHRLLVGLDPQDPNASEHWPRYRELLPHVYASGLVGSDDAQGRALVVGLVRCLYLWGDLKEAARLAEQARDDWAARLGEADEQLLDVASHLGSAWWALGRYEDAAEVNQANLDARRRAHGDDARETIMAELRVAVDVRTRGDFASALELNRGIHDKAGRVFVAGDRITLQTAHDLAVVERLCGNYRRALELNQETSAARAALLGRDSAAALNTESGIYMDQRELGDYERALAGHEEMASRVSEALGEDTPEALRRFAYLAVARRKAGDYPAALELSGRTLERLRRIYGTDHSTVLACAAAHASDLRNNGQLHKAREVAEHVVDRYRASLGPEHPYTLSATANLAVLCRLDGNPEEARSLNERTLKRFRASLGASHPHAIACAVNLASDLAAARRTDAALAASSAACDQAQRVLGPENPTALAAALNYALDQRDAGEAEGQIRYAEVVQRYRGELGEEHPATRAAAEGCRADCDFDPLPL